jgi:recombination protein RecR
MALIPTALSKLIEAFESLPGVGPRTAERYAYGIVKNSDSYSIKIEEALKNARNGIGICKTTFALIESNQQESDLYTSPNRDKTVIAVVAEPFDIMSIEKTNTFKGTYHVLGGLISPIDGVNPDKLHIKELLQRVDKDKVKEIILATNASVEGESTALYIKQQLNDKNVKITRLARGLSVGVDLEYADQITLSKAFEGRQEI